MKDKVTQAVPYILGVGLIAALLLTDRPIEAALWAIFLELYSIKIAIRSK